jgi:alpha-beta hydrolase superfamily lysophospholipase
VSSRSGTRTRPLVLGEEGVARPQVTGVVVPVILAAVVSLAVMGCGSPATTGDNQGQQHQHGVQTVSASATANGPSAFYAPPDPLPPAPPGTLIRDQVVHGAGGVPTDATLWRILYHSRSIAGADIAVSGYVAVPPTPAPTGGYPVLAWAHGTTGAAVQCAPSLFNRMEGEGPYPLPDLGRYLRAGWLVAATDYQGLGSPAGIHPYLVGASEGYGVLDAAVAARQLPHLAVSADTLIYGHSQGGHAALFAGELAPTYAPALHVIGVVAAAPATGLSTIVSVIGHLTVPDDLAYFTLIGWTWSKTYPDLPTADFFTPVGARLAERTVTGLCDNGLVAALSGSAARNEFQPGAAANPSVLAHGRLNDPGQVRTAAPMLIVQGTGDNQVPSPLTDLFVSGTACPQGDVVDYVHYPGASHDLITSVAVPRILAWSADRLKGRTPAPTTCGLPGDLRTDTGPG